MGKNSLQLCIDEFRERVRETKQSAQWKNFEYLIRILFDVRRLIKLLDPLTWRVVISYTLNQPGLSLLTKIRRVLTGTIKTTIFFVVLVGRFPTPRNFVVRKNDTVFDKASVSSHIHSFVLSILTPPEANAEIKRKKPKKYKVDEYLLWGELQKRKMKEDNKSKKNLLYQMEEYAETRRKQEELCAFYAETWAELQVSSNPTERAKLIAKLSQLDFSVIKQSETIDMATLVSMALYLRMNISIHDDEGFLKMFEGFFNLKMVGDFLNKFQILKEFRDRRDKEKSLYKRIASLRNMTLDEQAELIKEVYRTIPIKPPNRADVLIFTCAEAIKKPKVLLPPFPHQPSREPFNLNKAVDNRYLWDICEDLEYEIKLNEMKSQNFRFILSFIVKVLRFCFLPTTRVGKKFEDRITRLEHFFDKYSFMSGIRALRRFLVDHNFTDQVDLLDRKLIVLKDILYRLDLLLMKVRHFGKYNPKADRKNLRLASVPLAHMPAEFRERYKEYYRYTPALTFFFYDNFVCKDKKMSILSSLGEMASGSPLGSRIISVLYRNFKIAVCLLLTHVVLSALV